MAAIDDNVLKKQREHVWVCVCEFCSVCFIRLFITDSNKQGYKVLLLLIKIPNFFV